jgi:hypothetical protein
MLKALDLFSTTCDVTFMRMYRYSGWSHGRVPVLYHVWDQSISFCLANGSSFSSRLKGCMWIHNNNILPTTSFFPHVWHIYIYIYIYILSNKLIYVLFSLTWPTFSSSSTNKLGRVRHRPTPIHFDYIYIISYIYIYI